MWFYTHLYPSHINPGADPVFRTQDNPRSNSGSHPFYTEERARFIAKSIRCINGKKKNLGRLPHDPGLTLVCTLARLLLFFFFYLHLFTLRPNWSWPSNNLGYFLGVKGVSVSRFLSPSLRSLSLLVTWYSSRLSTTCYSLPALTAILSNTEAALFQGPTPGGNWAAHGPCMAQSAVLTGLTRSVITQHSRSHLTSLINILSAHPLHHHQQPPVSLWTGNLCFLWVLELANKIVMQASVCHSPAPTGLSTLAPSVYLLATWRTKPGIPHRHGTKCKETANV